jgi:hypothetical protein
MCVMISLCSVFLWVMSLPLDIPCCRLGVSVENKDLHVAKSRWTLSLLESWFCGSKSWSVSGVQVSSTTDRTGSICSSLSLSDWGVL